MTDYLTKPIDKSLLLTMVQKCTNPAPSSRNSPLRSGMGLVTDLGK